MIELIPDANVAGLFQLSGQSRSIPARHGFAKEDETALLLHTSGTTSRPKIVPLTQSNLAISVGNIRNTLQLTVRDRCLNIMPLFHIHGLMAAVLASMSAGAGVVCTPGFYAPRFFEWLDAFTPTWYTAVPSMPDILKVAARFFSQHEQAQLAQIPQDQLTRAFFKCWTCKEAFIKNSGEGLNYLLDQFDVNLHPDQPARLL